MSDLIIKLQEGKLSGSKLLCALESPGGLSVKTALPGSTLRVFGFANPIRSGVGLRFYISSKFPGAAAVGTALGGVTVKNHCPRLYQESRFSFGRLAGRVGPCLASSF